MYAGSTKPFIANSVKCSLLYVYACVYLKSNIRLADRRLVHTNVSRVFSNYDALNTPAKASSPRPVQRLCRDYAASCVVYVCLLIR
jgi:hypothetical protein